jgi:hypothetical protein
MTAIVLNDGEIGAPGHGKCVRGSVVGEIASRTADGSGKNISRCDCGSGSAHRAARESHIIRGFVVFAKIF